MFSVSVLRDFWHLPLGILMGATGRDKSHIWFSPAWQWGFLQVWVQLAKVLTCEEFSQLWMRCYSFIWEQNLNRLEQQFCRKAPEVCVVSVRSSFRNKNWKSNFNGSNVFNIQMLLVSAGCFFHKALALKFYFFPCHCGVWFSFTSWSWGDVIKCYRITTLSPVLVDELMMIFTC